MNGIQQEWVEFYSYVVWCDIVFYYVGYFFQIIIVVMVEVVKLCVEYIGVLVQIWCKLFFFFIEMVQNIVYYLVDLYEKEGKVIELFMCYGVVYIIQIDGCYFLYCVNLVDVEMVDKLCEKLEYLCLLINEEIKVVYKEMLCVEILVDSKGVGLGFLMVVCDVSVLLDFEFFQFVVDGVQIFYFWVII